MKFVLIFILVLVVGDANANIEKYEAFDNWLYKAFSIEVPTNENNILALGELTKKTEHTYSVGHSTPPLKFVVFEFDGLTIGAVVEQTPEKRAYISEISISSRKWSISNGISVGQSSSQLSKLAVPPEEGGLEFCGLNNCLKFQVHNNKISHIQILLYVD